MEDKNEKDELVFLADWLKKAINLVLRFFLNVFEFSIKKFTYILLFIILGTCSSYFAYLMFMPGYKGYIIVRQNSKLFNLAYCRNILEGLNGSIDFSNNSDIKDRLNIDGTIAGSILNLSLIQNKSNLSDSLSSEFPILISITLTRNEDIKILADALVGYLNNIPFYKDRISEELRQCKRTLDLFDQKIKELEVLRAKFDTNVFMPNRTTSIFFSEPIDYISTYEKLISLNLQRQLYLEKLKVTTQFTMVDYSIYSLSSRYRLEKFILFGIFMGYIIGLIVVYFFEFFYLHKSKNQLRFK